jgi:hypothetical protein
MTTSRSSFKGMLIVLAAAMMIVPMFLWIGCDKPQDAPSAGIPDQNATVLSKENPQVRTVMEVQDRSTGDLMSVPGVVGTATGLAPDGRVAILVYLKEAINTPVKGKGISARGIPAEIEGIPVITQVTGEFRAMKGGGGGGGVSHTAIQSAPIQLGTSGGWRYDLANGYCCGGTLGSLIQKGGSQYVLSNYHVLYSDIVNGGNGRVASAGDPVVQPGLIDVNCTAGNAQNVATLVANGGSLPGANVDAGIAQVISGMVRTDGSILEVGTISATTVGASIGQAVKKSGRTTGLSRSSVSGLNATVNIQYENECAGGNSFVQQYTGQIVIANSGSRFLNSGDSGSLMVQDVTTSPKAVGLLYAGSSSTAIANPIGDVLSFYGATMVGN